MSDAMTVNIAFFLAIEVGEATQVVFESPNFDGTLSDEEMRVVLKMASRLLDQELVLSGDGGEG